MFYPEEWQVQKKLLRSGAALLGRPVLPLVSMVEFFLLTGGFTTASEVIDQLPAPIATEYADYEQPKESLAPYRALLNQLPGYFSGQDLPCRVTDVEGKGLDRHTAAGLWIRQEILTAELEKINSLLCGPCRCTLCCIGPDETMEQDFFEIPLRPDEVALFPVEQIDTVQSRQHAAMDASCLYTDQGPFYQRPTPVVIRWRDGWSMILPKGSSCPQQEAETGRCDVYEKRPLVCRRPQIFPYILEPVRAPHEARPVYRQRSTILAVMDCPYVQLLQEEIAAYAAACELEVLFSYNKG
ncbi:MAG: hypothetical protein CSA33_04560 [Desulfobulbus propionicus]|nr:MAG: hypothetical protein CSA33_04560 [Desulfobulbus propionicus]